MRPGYSIPAGVLARPSPPRPKRPSDVCLFVDGYISGGDSPVPPKHKAEPAKPAPQDSDEQAGEENTALEEEADASKKATCAKAKVKKVQGKTTSSASALWIH